MGSVIERKAAVTFRDLIRVTATDSVLEYFHSQTTLRLDAIIFELKLIKRDENGHNPARFLAQQERTLEAANGALDYFNSLLGTSVKMPKIHIRTNIKPKSTYDSSAAHYSIGRTGRIYFDAVTDSNSHAYVGLVAHEIWHAINRSLNGRVIFGRRYQFLLDAIEEGGAELADVTYRGHKGGRDLRNGRDYLSGFYREDTIPAMMIINSIRKDLPEGATADDFTVVDNFYRTAVALYKLCNIQGTEPRREFKYVLGNAFMLILLANNDFDMESTFRQMATHSRTEIAKIIFNAASFKPEEISEKLMELRAAKRSRTEP